MTDPLGLAAVGTAGYVAHRLFGKTLEEMGSDINELYRRGRDRILLKATEKIPDPEDGKTANLRVARDVLWNGVVADSDVCAEYFGGVLASSRTESGKDDSAIQYVDVIKSLSSKQLHLHYVIYRGLQALFLNQGTDINVGLGSELGKVRLYGFALDAERIGLNLDLDISVLSRNGLIGDGYELKDMFVDDGKNVPYFYVAPSSFGIALYAAAYNRLQKWRTYSSMDFGSLQGVPSLNYVARTIEGLYRQVGMTLSEDVVTKFRKIEGYVEPVVST